jgi:hypothetical protein
MKNILILRRVIFFIVPVLLFCTCKKDGYVVPSIATLTVVNAVVGAPIVYVRDVLVSNAIANNNHAKVPIRAGDFDLYVWPKGDSLHPYHTNPKFYAENRGQYSLFLAGETTDVNGILLQESFPYHVDSSFGIRFINLSPHSPPLNITLSRSPAINEVSNISYLQYTDFKTYNGKGDVSNYIIQIRRASDNTLLLSYFLNPIPRFANVTLVIRGIIGMIGNKSLGITRVYNDR